MIAVVEEKTPQDHTIFGESVHAWEQVGKIKGYLDYLTGSASTQNYNSLIQESTHVFICDIPTLKLDIQVHRLTISENVYQIIYVDNPMGLNKHLEIYLKYQGQGTQQ